MEEKARELYRLRYHVLAAVMLGGIMGPIDGSIVNTILPTLSEFFKAPVSAVQWVPMIYLLTVSSLLLLYGRLGDIYGYRRVYLWGLSSFVVTSALCGLSPSIRWLIFFRALQGLAAGMMMAVPFAIITAVFPPTERGRALGINAISISAGLAIGPSLGGLITSLLGWRYAFLINIPIGLFGLYWACRIIPDLKGEPGRVDVMGAVTAFGFLFAFLMFVNIAQRYGCNRLAAVALAISLLFLAAFLGLERKLPQPMLNLYLFKNINFSFACLSALFNFMAQYVLVFVTPFYLQRVLGFDSGKVGLIMTAFPLAVMAVAPFSGSLSDRIGTTLLPVVGASTSALAVVMMSTLSSAAPPSAVIWRLVVFGAGTGIFQSPNTSAAMGTVPRPYLGIASGVLATVRNVGMVLGIATAGAALYAFTPHQMLQSPVLGSGEALEFLHGLQRTYLVGALLCALAALSSLVRRNLQGGGEATDRTSERVSG
ncbi:MAG: MFS transporter [Thermacetogeniaceae bacterium]